MANWKLALLRLVLVLTALGSLVLLNALWFAPDTVLKIYGGETADDLHRVLAVLFGAAIAGYVAATLLALWRPVEFRVLVLLLGLFHALITAADVYLIANGIGREATLVSQATFDLIITLALLGLYPATLRTQS